MRKPPRHLVLNWIGLLVLFAGNIILAYFGPSGLTPGITLIVAAVMAFLVVAVFMELGRAMSLYWAFAGAGFFWLAILFVLTAGDYLTRYAFAPV